MISKRVANGLAEDEFVIARIAGMKTQGKTKSYLIEWEGYDLKDNTWEQENNVYSEKAIKTFLNAYDIESKAFVKPQKMPPRKILLSNTYDPDTDCYYQPKSKSRSLLKVKATGRGVISAALVTRKKRTREVIESETETVLMSKPSKEIRHEIEVVMSEAEKAFVATVNDTKRSVEVKHPIVKTSNANGFEPDIYSVLNLHPPVTIVNTVDSELPTDFVYIDDLKHTSPVQPPDPDFLSGCICKSTCRESCHDGMAYDKKGRLVIDQGTPIYECNQACECNKNICGNRIVQKGRQVPLQVFKTPTKGWGVRSMSFIPKGTFVDEYIGEVITVEEGDKRGVIYDRLGCSYLFDMDFAQSELPTKYVIDSFALGNVSRFFNHSCSPNLEVYAVFYDSADNQMHRLAFFAKRDIQLYEELCFDYNGRRDVANQMEVDGAARYSCRCDAPDCRKWIYH
ncbi:hypothetical protein EDC96DRAFT_506313 [Choanephora cucurbitarum]|nr:hypothetical protein EDC96DRAFT_506313 [Choanephora cucurbitarum]